jgi:hypothetical protein
MEKQITEALIAITFGQDNFVRVKQPKAEEIFRKIVDKESLNTNLPDDKDPGMPRILFRDSMKGIAISQLGAQLILRFETTGNLSGSTEEILNYIDLMFNAVSEFEGEENIKDSGVVVSVIYPSDKKTGELNKNLFDAYSKFEPQGDLINIIYKAGFKVGDGLFLGYDIGVYEASPVKGQIESGYTARVDLNNKPAFMNPENKGSAKPDGIKSKFKEVIAKGGGLDKFLKKII